MSNQTNEQKQRDIKATLNPTAGTLRLDFANGGNISFHVSEMPQAVCDMALLHGFKQKLVDAAAISRDTKTGKSASIEDKFSAVYAVYSRLLDGAWNEEREGGGQQSYLLQAIMQVKGKDEATVREWLGKKTDAEKKALELNPAIASVITSLKAAKAKNVDSDALLGELE